jgi:hypothetical protein
MFLRGGSKRISWVEYILKRRGWGQGQGEGSVKVGSGEF